MLRGTLAVLGVLAFAVGVVFIGQGTNAMHGSSMSGHGSYAGLGAVLVVAGLALVVWARPRRGRRSG